MTRLHPVALAPLVAATFVASAFAQAPNPTGRTAPATASQPAVSAPAPATAPATQPAVRPAAAAPRRRSIVHHYPYPYPGYYQGDRSGGWRNPGGVGRYREYYAPYSQYDQVAPVHGPYPAATFGNGGLPGRQEQLQAQQIGIQRENAIQQHIDNYARPYYGYGLGVGFFGGFN